MDEGENFTSDDYETRLWINLLCPTLSERDKKNLVKRATSAETNLNIKQVIKDGYRSK
jgi:hypothetical protein